MKITKEYLKKLIMEEVGPSRGLSNFAQLQHMYPGQGGLKNFAPTGEPPDNQTRDKAATRPPYETLGVKVDIEEGDAVVTSGKTRYKIKFVEGSNRQRVEVAPIDTYEATIDNGNVVWDHETPAFVKFDPHLDKSLKELVSVDFDDQEESGEDDEN